MIGPGTGVRVYLACGVTDMRKGIAGLSALTQDVLRQKPTSGAVFAFRGRRGDRIKLLFWDGQGFCLYYKVLERGRFPWPTATERCGTTDLRVTGDVLVSKFDDHLPLYRQHEIFERMGADIPESTLVGWCGRSMKTLSPLIERIEADIMGSDLLHADDTPIRVLDRSKRDKGLGKGVKQGRIWTYVRDQRPWAGASPPGAVYRFAPN
eukprot:GHVR01153312.1.p1 GENE.GHVR01153312.1~~GHVR01153312.1.p1  ORF type:complete len:208 (+),score=28.77 GHVR01153312.1:958-1581(+)